MLCDGYRMIDMKIGTSQFHFIFDNMLISTKGDTREVLVSNYCVWITIQDYIVKPIISCTSKLVPFKQSQHDAERCFILTNLFPRISELVSHHADVACYLIRCPFLHTLSIDSVCT